MEKERALRRARLALRIATLTILATFAISLFMLGSGIKALAEAQGNAAEMGKGLAFIGAGIAVGLAGIGGGYAVGQAGAAMIAGMVEKPEMFGRMFIVLVLGEGIALYGLLVAILLWASR